MFQVCAFAYYIVSNNFKKSSLCMGEIEDQCFSNRACSGVRAITSSSLKNWDKVISNVVHMTSNVGIVGMVLR